MDVRNQTINDVGCPTNSTNFTESVNVLHLRYATANVFGSFVTIIIALVAITGNAAVVLVSFWSETLRLQTGNLLVVSLSCLDILTGMFVMIPSAIAVASDEWVLGNTMCRLHAGLNYTFACSSSYNLAAINVDRAVAVLYPFKYRAFMTTRVMIYLCFSIFAAGIICGIVTAAPDWTSYDYYEGVCAMDYTTSTGVYYVVCSCMFFCYMVPATTIVTCNTLIILTAKKSNKKVQPLFVNRDALKQSSMDSHLKKTIKSMLVVIVIYYICFTPYSISKQFKVAAGIDMPPWFNYITTIFIFVSSGVNPFIYGILRKDYREAFKKLPRMLFERL